MLIDCVGADRTRSIGVASFGVRRQLGRIVRRGDHRRTVASRWVAMEHSIQVHLRTGNETPLGEAGRKAVMRNTRSTSIVLAITAATA